MATTIEFKRLLEAVDRLSDEEFEELQDRVVARLHREEKTLLGALQTLAPSSARDDSSTEDPLALIRARFKRDS